MGGNESDVSVGCWCVSVGDMTGDFHLICKTFQVHDDLLDKKVLNRVRFIFFYLNSRVRAPEFAVCQMNSTWHGALDVIKPCGRKFPTILKCFIVPREQAKTDLKNFWNGFWKSFHIFVVSVVIIADEMDEMNEENENFADENFSQISFYQLTEKLIF